MSLRRRLEEVEDCSEQCQETDHGRPSMDEDKGFLRYLAAQMDRRQIEAAERGDHENQQRSERRARNAARQRSINEHEQTYGRDRRVQKNRGPRNKPSM